MRMPRFNALKPGVRTPQLNGWRGHGDESTGASAHLTEEVSEGRPRGA